ncbi:M28 family peptidase [Terriglobus saanensis]|uniref:Peptidase M28 n=1 Tax=Terriglobus saanensis (strain ATCC BAA-1853 / DSM 23119 / SP1PR4) TaxID=401053 RepID=E8V2J5_TERSS|nr:M28 family peptidase [Terriglobus saanensis]ADV82413.1 peptidase M28 [Terriglobus saanensis SP1PR4]
MNLFRGYTATMLLVTTSALFAQQRPASGGYDPGIRPTTPATLRQEKEAEDAWFGHLKVLAGDELKGRLTGTPDFIHAVEYVESQFKAIGLKPAGKDGFRQAVGFRTVTTDVDHSSFQLARGGDVQALKLGTEVVLNPHVQDSNPVEASTVFAGYGFAVPSQGFDDLQGVDLHGKIAIVFAGSPPSVHGPLKAYFRTPAERWKALKGAGAIGLITIPEPRQLQGGPQRALTGVRPFTLLTDPELDALSGLRLSATLPIASAQVLFAGSAHSLDELLSLAKNGQPLPKFPLAVSVRATTATHELSRFEAPNVVALLEGSDRKLKHEYVVLSAHLDHLGVGRAVDGDSIYNGAMDNAAGVASLLETAKALAKGSQPKRSILFLALTGEEEGELGSQFFARYPTVPRKQIVAELNMDMYLPIFPLRFLEVQGLGESTLGNDARAAAQLNDIEVQFDKQPDENRFIRSDQASFVKYGIPALAFKFGWLPDTPEQKAFNDWIKNRYHRPSDDLEQPIDKAAAVQFDHVLLTLITRVANATAKPGWYPESFFSTIPRS